MNTEPTDEELISAYRSGDAGALDLLMNKYRNLVKREMREMFIIGADAEDLMQEGMIGLFKAVQDYDAAKNSSFYTFAAICVKRQIYKAVTMSNRLKHGPLNGYVSFYANEEEGKSLSETLEAGDESNPEHMLLIEEQLRGIYRQIATELSKYEQQVLNGYLDGKSYGEIAAELGKTEKSVDNAIQRIRKKLEQ